MHISLLWTEENLGAVRSYKHFAPLERGTSLAKFRSINISLLRS